MGRGRQTTAERTAYNRRWRAANPDKVAAWRPDQNRRQRERYKRKKAEVVAAYGGCCVCCGEAIPTFLTFDHISGEPERNPGGQRVSGTAVLYRLHKLLPATDPDIQVLCFNCNSGRAINGGVCPHQEVMPNGLVRAAALSFES